MLTDWIRAAVAGATADGREITEQQLEDIALSYSQDTYNARIWPEHIRGIAPDGMFKALGDVVEVKAERISGGALAGKMALYTKLSPHPDLIGMVRNGQKVHLSVEINPKFADTGKAYLMGLGVTDSPASLGTGIMKFSTSARLESLFSTPEQADIKQQQDTSGGGVDYSLHFAQMQGQNKAMLQQFNTMQGDITKVLEEIGLLKASLKETHTIVEEIGNASTGRFQRRPATGGGFSHSQKIDY